MLHAACSMDCIFCKIANKEIPADVVYESDDIVAFKDAHPVAPVHILIIPKRHIESIDKMEESDIILVGRMIWTARNIARGDFRPKADQSRAEQVAEKGYKLLIRTGPDGGQEIPHLHLHLIGGAKLFEEIRSV